MAIDLPQGVPRFVILSQMAILAIVWGTPEPSVILILRVEFTKGKTCFKEEILSSLSKQQEIQGH